MKEESPAIMRDNKNVIVFIEKIFGDVAQCISFNDENTSPIRIKIDLVKLDVAANYMSKIPLSDLKLYYHVKSTEVSSKVYGSGNYEVIQNSILQLSCMERSDKSLAYGLVHGRKVLYFDASDIEYIPMLNNNHDNTEDFSIGSEVVSIVDNCCHNLVKNRKYHVKDMITNVNSIMYGTLYLEDSISGCFVTTYPCNVKKSKNNL